jgi:RimJ/RimL family protein N-acetyltransferase
MQSKIYPIVDKNGDNYSIHKITLKENMELANFLSKLSSSTTELFHPHPFDIIFLSKMLKSGKDLRVILRNSNNKIIGYAFLSKIPLNSGIGYFGIVISEQFQGRGLGELFTKALIEIGKTEVFNKIILNVYSDNLRAKKLYVKLGFKKVKVNLFLLSMS